MMTKKEKEFANYLVNSLVEALKASNTTSVSANKGRKSATPNEAKKPETSKHSMKLTDYEPKGEKTEKGYTNWASYKAKRSDYCYAVATNGKYLGCYENGKKVVEFDDIEKKYNEAKKKYEAKYHYVKKADR